MSDTLQKILARAEQRHTTQNGNAEFLLVLLQQSAAELKLSRMAVWIQTHQASRVIAQTGERQHEQSIADDLKSVAFGEVRVLDSAEASHSAAGIRSLTASSVATDLRLILETVDPRPLVDQDILIQLADVFADLQRRRMLESFMESSKDESAWQSLIAQLHTSLDSSVIANTVATDMVTLLPCRRIAVGRRRGRRWDVVATTGVSQPNERSDASRRISQWIESAAAGDPVNQETQHSLVRPLCPSGDWSDARWAVVLEAEDKLDDHTQLERCLKHASLALSNSATSKRGSPISILRRGFRSLVRPRALVMTGMLAAFIAVLLLVQTDLRIEVYGELVPTKRAFIFAPDDGTITELHVEEDTEVSDQDVLCVLTNEDLNVQLEAIDGQLAAANARLAAIDALRGGRGIETSEARILSAERAELEEQVKSLTRQSAIVTERLDHLRVVSRLTGRVYGDRLRQNLFQRPVQRGQYLFEVADPSAGWQLHLRVPEADMRYVLAAAQLIQEHPAVSFSLETSPEITRQTSLNYLGTATDVDSQGELSTVAIANLQGGGIHAERPGAGVVARIRCGQRSAGFVWFRQVIEFIQRQTWL